MRFKEKNIALLLVFLYLVISIIYGVLEPNTWDDDCPRRFFNTVNSFSHPENFISTWNRPLFVLVYSIPAQLGYWAVMMGQIIIGSLSGWFLYKALKIKDVNNVLLILPLFFFQTFYFSISRNAETEPLAVFLIVLGYYFLQKKQFFYFAIAGALLPLARLELSILLLFWGIELYKANKLNYLFYFLVPGFIWSVSGFIIKGDFFYLINQTVGGDHSENRYGHTGFFHYFIRFIYTIGPAVYFLFLFGLFVKLFEKIKEHFVLTQFLAGFGLYVIFSSFLNIGNSAGFLRNLIPLTPLVAIIALEGFNWLSDSNKNRKKVITFGWLSIFMLITVFISQSFELVVHHNLSNIHDWSNLFITIGMILIMSISVMLKKMSKWLKLSIPILIGLTTVGFTALKELPHSNESIERSLVEQIATQVENSYSDAPTVYVNHIWYYWSQKINPLNKGYKSVSMINLDKAQANDICVWENHYSNRLSGDVMLDYFTKKKDWIEVSRFFSSKTKFNAIVYLKIDSNINKIEIYNDYINNNPNDPMGYYNRGKYLLDYKNNNDKALSDFERTILIDSNIIMSYYEAGIITLNQKKHEKSLNFFNKTISLNPSFEKAFYFKAIVLEKKGDVKEAVKSITKAYDLSDNLNYIEQRAKYYFSLSDYNNARVDYETILKIKPKNAEIEKRLIEVLMRLNKWRDCLERVDNMIILQSSNSDAWMIKGMCHLNLNENKKACQSWRKALVLGEQKSTEYLNYYCK